MKTSLFWNLEGFESDANLFDRLGGLKKAFFGTHPVLICSSSPKLLLFLSSKERNNTERKENYSNAHAAAAAAMLE